MSRKSEQINDDFFSDDNQSNEQEIVVSESTSLLPPNIDEILAMDSIPSIADHELYNRYIPEFIDLEDYIDKPLAILGVLPKDGEIQGKMTHYVIVLAFRPDDRRLVTFTTGGMQIVPYFEELQRLRHFPRLVHFSKKGNMWTMY